MKPCPTTGFDTAPVSSDCTACRHPIGSHLYPAGICMQCVADRLALIEALLEADPPKIPWLKEVEPDRWSISDRD